MTLHPDVETLSTYLDSELSGRERNRIEQHLELCSDCQERLSGLRRVVGDLKALERLAPPPHLGADLQRRASLEISRPTLIQRLEQGVARVNLQSNLASIFAIVVALILIIYLLSWGLHRQATGRIPVHLEPQGTTIPEATVSQSSQQLAGRTFDLIEGVWIERGLPADAEPEQISESDPRLEGWFARYPELEVITDLDGRVRLAIEEEVVEIRFDMRSRSP